MASYILHTLGMSGGSPTFNLTILALFTPPLVFSIRSYCGVVQESHYTAAPVTALLYFISILFQPLASVIPEIFCRHSSCK